MDLRRSWRLHLPGGRVWRVGPTTQVVGILNCTPDSFSDGGRFAEVADAVEAGIEMLADGADCLDVGGESTRPGADDIPAGEQIGRVCPVIEGLRKRSACPISVDTRLPEVAGAALEAGADIVNDVAGFRDPGWERVLKDRPVPVIVVHMQGNPQTMQIAPSYPYGVRTEVEEFFKERIESLSAIGVARERILLDPGIGFGKRLDDNLDLLASLGAFRELDRPLYVGVSRKRLIGDILERPVDRREAGTLAANAFAILAGASVLRVHDVRDTRDLVRLLAAIDARARDRGDGEA